MWKKCIVGWGLYYEKIKTWKKIKKYKKYLLFRYENWWKRNEKEKINMITINIKKATDIKYYTSHVSITIKTFLFHKIGGGGSQ
jgi:hypothetical protein